MASESDSRMDQIKQSSEFTTVTWTEQPLHFLNRLKTVVGSRGTFKCDTNIVCEGGSIKCHKMMLALCSPYFAKIFKNSKLGEKEKVLLPIVNKRTFTYLYEFICNGAVTLPMDQKDSLIEAGRFLQVEGLKEMIIKSSGPLQDKLVAKTPGKEFVHIGTQTNTITIPFVNSECWEKNQKEMDENLTTVVAVSAENESGDRDTFSQQLISNKPMNQKKPPDEKPGPSSSFKATLDSKSSKDDVSVLPNDLLTKETAVPKKSKTDLMAFMNDSSDDSDFMDIGKSRSEPHSPLSKARNTKIANRLKINPVVKMSMSKQLASKQISKGKRKSSTINKGESKTNHPARKKSKSQDNETIEKISCEFQDCDFIATTEAEMRSHNDQHNARHYCGLCPQVFMLEENRDAHVKNCSAAKYIGSSN